MSNFAAWPCNCRIPWLDSRFRVIFVGILNFLASAHPSILEECHGNAIKKLFRVKKLFGAEEIF